MARFAFAAAASTVLTASAFATVTPTTLFGDSYIIKDGVGADARFYSVLDVYLKGNNANDIVSSTFGVSAWVSSYTQDQGKAFVQTNGTATNSWLPTNDDGKGWDSYVTCGARVQGSDATLAGGKAGFLGMQLDTNWASSSSGSQIVGQAGGAGWYPSIGANTTSNPYCRFGYNGGTSATAGYWNTAKATTNIAGNGITVGQSLNNHWMIGRFVVDVTQSDPSTPVTGPLTMSMKFAVAGKNNGSTTFTGATAAAGRFNYTLSFAVPAPGAAALVGLAGVMTRRRARA
jgi:hypothetical protein